MSDKPLLGAPIHNQAVSRAKRLRSAAVKRIKEAASGAYSDRLNTTKLIEALALLDEQDDELDIVAEIGRNAKEERKERERA